MRQLETGLINLLVVHKVDSPLHRVIDRLLLGSRVAVASRRGVLIVHCVDVAGDGGATARVGLILYESREVICDCGGCRDACESGADDAAFIGYGEEDFGRNEGGGSLVDGRTIVVVSFFFN